FKPVYGQANFPELELEILALWRKQNTFHKSMESRHAQGAPRYVFYEGPPTANGRPGAHHVLARVFKDLLPRYKTMRGYYCLRKGGWDTHGLPVEIEVEKELGFTGKKAIEDYGIARFNQKCRESVFRYVEDWERMTERIGFWIDLPSAYVTLHNEYIESLWWILKQFWDQGLLYQGYKVVPYCPRCGTPLSSHELALGYKEGTRDPSIYVKFPLRDEPGTYFLVWTTTPWTLPGNVALAVHPDVDYVMVEQGEDRLILAEPLLDAALVGEYKVLKRMQGKVLVGKHYRPLYTFLPVETDYAYVVPAEFVTVEDGTGIVHIAPAFGADDLEVGREYSLPVLMTVAPDGTFIDAVCPWAGVFVKDADPLIQEELHGRGLMYREGIYEHTYPFCWRCDTPLLYYAKTTWYIATTKHKDQLLANNELINWYPDHIKYGRFGNWLENNVDWALGRDRYWGTPLPIWECEQCGHQECIGSVAELSEKTGTNFRLKPPEGAAVGTEEEVVEIDLHRPHVDEISWDCPECGAQKTMHRVEEVADCWFDSGSMPVAQWHYPFDNQDMFQDQFPADFICEAVDQTRGWFYTLHAVSTLLFDQPSFKNVICLGLIVDAKGQKMSKSRGNVVNPWDVLDVHGADALRWYLYTAGPPGQNRRFSVDLVGEVVRKFMLTLWNSYSFFVTYANLDGWTPNHASSLRDQLTASNRQRATSNEQPATSNELLDRWILGRLHQLIALVTERLDHYDVTGAARPIADFVEDLSNWYLRRSRRRFWRRRGESEAGDRDKQAAYSTLYEVLVTLSHLLAPFTPFVAEAMYQNLVRSVHADAPESVHLSDWPQADTTLVDEQLLADVALVQSIVSLGHAARQSAGIKVRQPLAEVIVRVQNEAEAKALQRLEDQILDELNVKKVHITDRTADLAEISINLLPQKLGPRLGRRFPLLRRAMAGMDQVNLATRLMAGKQVTVEVEGETIELSPEEAEVRFAPKEGFAMAQDAVHLVAISTSLTPALVREGYARELVRHIQNLRKEAGYDLADRITLYVDGGDTVAETLAEWGGYIAGETLATKLLRQRPPEIVDTKEQFKLDSEPVTIAVYKEKA
ncbi:MAG TPA: isoleucine--tRNA ligase, partial [Anaerolineae bacterium]|nr:isoleucine--tRNA ligase [Anaerolineae bacterium]